MPKPSPRHVFLAGRFVGFHPGSPATETKCVCHRPGPELFFFSARCNFLQWEHAAVSGTKYQLQLLRTTLDESEPKLMRSPEITDERGLLEAQPCDSDRIRDSALSRETSPSRPKSNPAAGVHSHTRTTSAPQPCFFQVFRRCPKSLSCWKQPQQLDLMSSPGGRRLTLNPSRMLAENKNRNIHVTNKRTTLLDAHKLERTEPMRAVPTSQLLARAAFLDKIAERLRS